MNRDVLQRLRANTRARAAALEPPTQPRPARPRKRRTFFLPLFFILSCTVLALAGWSAASNPALASLWNLSVTPTVMQQPRAFWAQAALPKPAYTPTARPLPTAASLPATASLPETVLPPLVVNIVEDTPAPGPASADTNPDQPAPVPVSSGSKSILVDISEQHLYAYENGQLVYSFIASTGMNNATAVGNFAVQSKIPNAYGSTWNIWMPNWLGIYWAGGLENGIHALPILPDGSLLWEGFLGRPISYGCVVLGTNDSKLLYDWADYGTPVEIQR